MGLTKENLVKGFRQAKTKGSPWCYLSKVQKAVGVSDSQMTKLVRDLKSGRVSRRVGEYLIGFEKDISRYKSYASVNMMTIYPAGRR